jgi:23S rRNA pseudouridine955/2504/2580 synthase
VSIVNTTHNQLPSKKLPKNGADKRYQMKSFIITKNDAGQRLDKFITKSAPKLPYSMMYKGIRTKNIKVNRKRAQIDQRLQEGDLVELYLKDELLTPAKKHYDFLTAGKQLQVVYEDEHILLLNKPEGLLCHSDSKEFSDNLVGRVKRYLYEKGEYDPEKENSFTPALANRIDRNTTGIVMAAKTAEALRVLNQKIKDREMEKRYLCLVHGKPKENHAILTGYLTKDEDKNMVTVYNQPQPDGKTIVTEYKVLSHKNNMSLLKITLHTVRTNQIRAHLAGIGHPLVGDSKYGRKSTDKKKGFSYQALCSYQLTFRFTTDGGCLSHLNNKTFQLDHVWFTEGF